MKYKSKRAALACVGLLGLLFFVGCRQDMQDQPKFIPQRHSAFFQDGRSARPKVPGTVSRSEPLEDGYFYTGLINGAEGNALPFAANLTVLMRGKERFNIYCSPCHSRVGNGMGAIVGRGYKSAGNFQGTRLRQAPLGHFFFVMSHGYGAMPSYRVELAPEDRWAVAAYIRALQLSQNATSADVPSGAKVATVTDLLEKASYSKNFLDSWGVTADDDRSSGTPEVATALPVAAPPAAIKSAADANAKKTDATALSKELKAGGAQTVGKDGKQPVAVAEAHAAAAHKGDPEHGKVIYSANCMVCHQASRAGIPPIFPSLLGIVETDGEAKVRRVVKEGVADAKPPMPPHPDFKDSDFDDLIAYLRTK